MGTILAILVTVVVLVIFFILISADKILDSTCPRKDELDYDDLDRELEQYWREAGAEIDLFNDIYGFLNTEVLNNTDEKIAALVEARFGIPAYMVLDELTKDVICSYGTAELVIAAYYNLNREEQIEILRINRG